MLDQSSVSGPRRHRENLDIRDHRGNQLYVCFAYHIKKCIYPVDIRFVFFEEINNWRRIDEHQLIRFERQSH